MTDRVRSLSLQVRSPRAGAGLQEIATDFVSQVLARATDGLRTEQRERVVFVRTLKLDLRMLEAGLGIPSEVDAVAKLLRAHVETLVSEAQTRAPSPTRDVVVFESAAAWRAAHVLAAPAEAEAWYFADLGASSHPSLALGLPDRTLALATLALLCERASEFERALARKDPPTLVAWLHMLQVLAAAISGRDTAARATEQPAHPRVDRLVAAVVSIARSIVAQRSTAVMETPRASHGQAPSAPRAQSGTERGEPIAADQPHGDATRPAAPARQFTSQPTQIARAAYLVGIWLELDSAQALYAAGLREGDWLARALAHTAGLPAASDDALCRAIAGGHDAVRFPEISPEKLEQACAQPLEAWLRCAARRRLIGVELTLGVERWGDQRLLVVRGGRCGMPIGALRADTIDHAAAALRRVTSLAPADSVLRGSRALVELDRSGRITPMLAEGATNKRAAACATLLVETLAGAALELYALRSGLSGDGGARSLAVAGRVVEDDELVLVEMDASAIDITLRAAGLDASPGWLPWLNKKLEIDFTGLETW